MIGARIVANQFVQVAGIDVDIRAALDLGASEDRAQGRSEIVAIWHRLPSNLIEQWLAERRRRICPWRCLSSEWRIYV
jgi:hypothetical protein